MVLFASKRIDSYLVYSIMKKNGEVIQMREIFKDTMPEIEIEDLAIDGICGVY